MKYDATIKELFPDTHVLFTLLTGSQLLELINIEFSSVQQRRADLIAWLTNGEILHLELQSDNDDTMLWRELEYCTLILKQQNKRPIQIVLYIGKESPRFITKIDYPGLKFDYRVIDIRELDCTQLLESDSLGDNLLSILGRLEDKRQAVHRIMQRIAKLDENKRADMLKKLAILSGLRPLELPKLIQEEAKEMSISIDLEENPLFADIFKRREQRGIQIGEQRGIQIGEQRGIQSGIQIGEQRGIQSGIQIGEQRGIQSGIQIGEQRGIQSGIQIGQQRGEMTVLRRLLERRFGKLPEWANIQIEQASSQQLETWSIRVLEATCLEEVFAQ